MNTLSHPIHSIVRQNALLLVAFLGFWIGGHIQPSIDAIENISEIIRSHPNDAESYFLGAEVDGNWRLKGAVADFSRAIECDTNYTDAYFWRADALAALGNYHAALIDYNRVLEANESIHATHERIGEIESALGDTASALVELDLAVSLDPTCQCVFDKRGAVLARIGKTQSAMSDYNQAIKLDPKYSGAHSSWLPASSHGRLRRRRTRFVMHAFLKD